MKANFIFSMFVSSLFFSSVHASTLAIATADADTIINNEPSLTLSATGGIYEKTQIVHGAKIVSLTIGATGLPAASSGGFTRIEITSPDNDRRVGWGPIAYNATRTKGIYTHLSTPTGAKWNPVAGSDWSHIKTEIPAGGDFTDTIRYQVYPTNLGTPREAGVYYLKFIGKVTHM